MIGTKDPNRPPVQTSLQTESTGRPAALVAQAEQLRLRAQQLSLRDQLERNHFLLKRLHASSARLVQSIETGDVCEAIAEIISTLIGSQQLAILHYCPAVQSLTLEWSRGVDAKILECMTSGAGMLGRAVHQALSQFRDHQPPHLLLPHETNLTACVVLKSGLEVSGAIAIFELLPQKSQLEWVDFELLKFLEVYAAVALHIQRLAKKVLAP